MPFLTIVWCRDPDAVRKVYAANHPEDETGHRIVGVFSFPRKEELTCTGFCTARGWKVGGWTRHIRGWMICGVCGQRHRDTFKRLRGSLFDYLGANLMGDKAPALFRTTPGYGRPKKTPPPE
jgi:hypothetical protein